MPRKRKKSKRAVCDLDGNKTSLEHARRWLRKRAYKGAECPCCKQYVKIYKRKLNKGMANGLAEFYCFTGGKQLSVHVPSTEDLAQLGGDFAKLVHWGLVEEVGEERDDGGRAGWWRITDLGVSFVRGNHAVASHARFYNGECLGLDTTNMITIQDAAGEEFDLEELLSAI